MKHYHESAAVRPLLWRPGEIMEIEFCAFSNGLARHNISACRSQTLMLYESLRDAATENAGQESGQECTEWKKFS